MDGKTLLYKLRQVLDEDSTSSFMDDRTSFDFLYQAAVELAIRTKLLIASQSITTVADQDGYTLSADYLDLYAKDHRNRKFVRYTDSSGGVSFPFWKDYEQIVFDNQTASEPTPNYFSVINDPDKDSRVSGTATSTAAATGYESTLADTAGNFADVSAGDTVHNTTDGSDGVVLSKTSSTVLVVALFGGTANDWTQNDAYVIQPQGRMKLIMNPPPSTAGDTIFVPYIKRPDPVYSHYGTYGFQNHHMDAMIKYAAWLYKYRDREAQTGDQLFQYWDRQIGLHSSQIRGAMNRKGMKVSWKAR
jgi:hypothetical protein